MLEQRGKQPEKQTQCEEQDRGTVAAGLGLLGQIPDDETHKGNQPENHQGHGNGFELFVVHRRLRLKSGAPVYR